LSKTTTEMSCGSFCCLAVQRIGVKGAVVDLVAGLVGGVEGHADALALLAAMGRGEEDGR
jgi:hypothetical protein